MQDLYQFGFDRAKEQAERSIDGLSGKEEHDALETIEEGITLSGIFSPAYTKWIRLQLEKITSNPEDEHDFTEEEEEDEPHDPNEELSHEL